MGKDKKGESEPQSKLSKLRSIINGRLKPAAAFCFYQFEALRRGRCGTHVRLVTAEMVLASKTRLRKTLLLLPVALFTVIGTAGIPIIGAPIKLWVWPLQLIAAICLWVGAHSLLSAGLMPRDLLPRASEQHGVRRAVLHAGAALPVAGFGLTAGVLTHFLAFVLNGVGGGMWQTLRLLVSWALISGGLLLLADETRRTARRWRRRNKAPQYIPYVEQPKTV